MGFVLFSVLVFSGPALGAVLQVWPKALFGMAALASFAYLASSGWILLDAADCWDCRSGDMSDGGWAMWGVMMLTGAFVMFLVSMAIGAAIGRSVRNSMR